MIFIVFRLVITVFLFFGILGMVDIKGLEVFVDFFLYGLCFYFSKKDLENERCVF